MDGNKSVASIDHLDAVEQQINQAFEAETEQARVKRDGSLALLTELRSRLATNNRTATVDSGATRPPQADTSAPRRNAIANNPPPLTDNGVTLKAAMLEAGQAVDEPFSRGKVLEWVFERYPKLRGSKEGTIASTFSRLKKEHWKEVSKAEPHLLRRRREGEAEQDVPEDEGKGA